MGEDPDLWFPAGTTGAGARQAARAKAICGGCPVRRECLDDATGRREEFGIWGGMTEDERRPGRRKARGRAA